RRPRRRVPSLERDRESADRSVDGPQVDAWNAESVGGEASRAMPAHDGVGLNEYQRRTPVAPALRQGDPKQSIACVERDSLLDTLHRCQLLAQGQILDDQLSMAAQRQRQAADNHEQQL